MLHRKIRPTRKEVYTASQLFDLSPKKLKDALSIRVIPAELGKSNSDKYVLTYEGYAYGDYRKHGYKRKFPGTKLR